MLDIPYKQIGHSDIFVLVRVEVAREHFLAFLKKISVIRDKILGKAILLGIISDGDLKSIWDTIPEFTFVLAYIAGFFDKRICGNKIKRRDRIFIVDEVMKTKRFITNKFVGYWHPKRELYKKIVIEMLRSQGRHIPDNVKLEFEGIGDFSSTLHFLVSSGALKRKREEWQAVIEEI